MPASESSPSTIRIEPPYLHNAWPFVKRGLEAVIKKTKPQWIAEDIYAAIQTNAASLFLSFLGTKPIGFTITYFAGIPFTTEKELFIWVAWTIPPAERATNEDVESAIRHNFEHLRTLAKNGGASRITCISPRPGFAKWAAKFGFHTLHHTFCQTI